MKTKDEKKFKLSICIISFNALDYLKKCLTSVYASHEDIEFEVIVVDNNSKEDNVGYIKKNFPQIKLIANQENNYFAAGNNQAFAVASGEYILLLNPDAEVISGSLTKMVQYLDKNKKIGVLGPKLLNSDGTLQGSISNYLTILDLIKEYTFYFKIERVIKKNPSQYSYTHFVDSMLGACLLVRKTVIDEVGPLDEFFKFYAEEVDFLFRVKEKKWKICFYPEVSIYHHSNKCAGQNKLRRVSSLEENLKSQYRFIRKHRKYIETFLAKLLLILVLYLRMISRLIISFITRKKDLELFKARINSYKRTIFWLLSEADKEKMGVYAHYIKK